MPNWSRPIIAGLLLLLLVTGIRSLVAAARARRIERQRELLASYVSVLQRSLVPELPEQIGDLSISAAYSAAEGPGAGGDFYDVFPLGGGRTGLILGDVSGHGRDALERATLARYTVRAFVEAGLEPCAALKVAGHALAQDGHDGFATVAVAVFDPSADALTYALAGHPPPILLGAGLEEPLSVFSSPPLGLGLPTGLRQTTVSLPEGAIACFFTDGLVEARASGRMLGREHLERLLMTVGADPGSADLVLTSLGESADRSDDDMAVCLLRQDGGAERSPLHVEELELGPGEIGEPGPVQLLTACGVGPGAVSAALEAAAAAAPDAAVLMRVELDGHGASVEVHELAAEPFEHAGSRSARVLVGQAGSGETAPAATSPAS